MTKPQWQKLLIILLGLSMVVLVGYAVYQTFFLQKSPESSIRESDPQKTESPTEHDHAPPPPLPVESQAPDFTLKSIDGKTIRLSQYQNRKLVLLEFLSTRCPHCVASIPFVKQLQQQYPDNLQILAVNAGDNPSKPSTATVFQKQYGITYPILDQPASSLLEQYRVWGFPTFYLIDKHGYIRWNHVGAFTQHTFQEIRPKLN